MKAKIIAFLFSLIAIAPLSAQHYRGFVDVYLLKQVQSPPSDTYSIEDSMEGVGITTSHGLQFNKLFVGLGAGYYLRMHNIPVFADARWDFFGTRGVNFFAGVKLGCNINQDPDKFRGHVSIKDPIANENKEHPLYAVTPLSLYFQPSVGMRIRTAPKFGLNISLSYIPIHMQIREYYNDNNNNGHKPSTPVHSYTKGYLALGLGFDF